MKKSEFYAKVEEAMQTLKIEKKSVYSVKELQDVANYVGVDMFYVMQYLRFGRIF